MNYIWEILLKAREEGIDESEIVFKQAKVYSPYMEMSIKYWNANKIGKLREIEINSFYRFYPIFKDMLNINIEEDIEVREVLFSSIIHFLGRNDLMQGMTKQEYHKRFMMNEILYGTFGSEIKELAGKVNNEDMEIILEELLCLYKTGVSIVLLKRVLKRIFSKSYIYNNRDNPREILIYFGEKRSDENKYKIKLIEMLFCRLDYEVKKYWEYHFGVVDVEETMCIDSLVVY